VKAAGATCPILNMPIHVFPDPSQLTTAVVREIIRECARAQAERGVFHLALSGGNTPQASYALLTEAAIDWTRVQIWFSDERCLPENDPQRNDTMAWQYLLREVALTSSQIYSIPAQLGPESAAKRYTTLLNNAPVMDLTLLGMGEDGHTASLFPDNPALLDEHLAVPVFNAPKYPPERVSMGFTALNQARRRLIMVAGVSKRPALQQIQQGNPLPITRLIESDWFIDAAANDPDITN